MTSKVLSVGLSTTAAQCVSTLSKGRFRHLPVKDGERIVANVTMVSIKRFDVGGAQQHLGAEAA